MPALASEMWSASSGVTAKSWRSALKTGLHYSRSRYIVMVAWCRVVSFRGLPAALSACLGVSFCLEWFRVSLLFDNCGMVCVDVSGSLSGVVGPPGGGGGTIIMVFESYCVRP